jgi:BMFP domain-containing protein YqiC
MPLSAARCVKAQFLYFIVLVALSCEAGAQPDARDTLIQELRQRIEALEKKLAEPSETPKPVGSQPDARDTLIQELRQRMEALEKKLAERPAPPPPPVAAPRPPAEAPKPAGAQPDPRDALILELRQRMEALEKKLGEHPAPPAPPAAAPPPPPAAARPSPPAGAPRAPAEAPKPSASEEAGREDEGSRALERTLVREGGLVLPRGVIEVESRLQYTYRGTQGLNVVVVNGVAQLAQQDVRRNDLEASVAVRRGLPGSLQVEARLPYVWIEQNRATSGAGSQSEGVSGWGDVELGLTKQLATERKGGLLGSLVWKSITGNHELGSLSPGSGFPHLQAALTAATREDPLVFLVTASYIWVFKRGRSGTDVNPGDAVGLKVGTVLAASPETSLRASFELTRSGRTRIAGADVAGSDTTVGILEVGLAKTLTRRTMLDVQLGIGVTPDAPDFRLRLALPIRFGP